MLTKGESRGREKKGEGLIEVRSDFILQNVFLTGCYTPPLQHFGLNYSW